VSSFTVASNGCPLAVDETEPRVELKPIDRGIFCDSIIRQWSFARATYVRGHCQNVRGTLNFDPADPRAAAVEATTDDWENSQMEEVE
jgi:hypothetical protein